MKHVFMLTLVAGLFIPAFTSNASVTESAIPTQEPFSTAIQRAISSAVMIGSGVVRSKSGNNYTIQSSDGNTYLAEDTVSYLVGASVLHTDPVNGWVEIIGHSE
jgi:hypothetical protein